MGIAAWVSLRRFIAGFLRTYLSRIYQPSLSKFAKRVAQVSGVRGVEPSIASTIQTLGARFGGDDDSARFGVVAHEDGAGYTVEVGLE